MPISIRKDIPRNPPITLRQSMGEWHWGGACAIRSLWVGLIGCLLVSVLSGCRKNINPEDALAQANATNLQRLANLYVAFQMENDWHGPADEAKFKEFLRNYNPKKLTRIGIDPNAIDGLFVSERDGQKFRIRYSVLGNMMGSSEPVVFEAKGVDGKRLIGFLDMNLREVDDAEYDALWEGKASLQQPTRRDSL